MKKQLLVLIIFLISGLGFSQETGLTHEATEISGGAEYSIMLQEAIRNGNVDMFRSLGESTQPPPYSPSAITIIEGINFNEDESNSGFFHIPPDPHGAAGPNHVVSVVNTSIEWHTKAGTQQNSQSLASFFASQTPLTGTFDPKVIYDQYNGRFVVVTLEQTTSPSNTSRILVAVSKTNDPNGGWWFTSINSAITIGSLSWADYPGLAVGDNAIYITNNMFTFSTPFTFTGARLWIVAKASFYAGGGATVTVHNPYPGGQATTYQPAHMFGTPQTNVGTFLLAYSGLSNGTNEFLNVVRVDNPLTAPSFNFQQFTVENIDNTAGPYNLAPQLGTATRIETNDRRSQNAVWRNNNLWSAFTVVPNSGVTAGEVTAHWVKINTATLGALSLLDQGNIGGETIATNCYTFFPSIAVNSTNDICIGFSASASSIYPGCYYTGRLSTDAAGFTKPPATVRAGLDYYIRTFGGPRNRWGDYSGTSVDPADDQTFYVFNEYALTRGTIISGEEGRWGTAFGKVPQSDLHQVWINEISYDMNGTDTDDFIEIVAPINTDMSAYGILLANGNSDESYGYVQLSGIVSAINSNNGFGFFILLSNQSSSVVVPVGITSQTETTNGFGSGIENGSPDGVLLLDATSGPTIHGIWYEEAGTAPTEITRTGTGSPPGIGPFSMTGVNITSLEDGGSTASGGSLSMFGSGNSGTWEVTLFPTGTPGNINTNQTSLPVELTSFSAIIMDNKIKLNWRTETEVNNYGFEVERQVGSRQSVVGNWEPIGFIDGYGNSNSPKEYEFIDENIVSGKYAYRLKQIDNDGTFEYSKVIEVDMDAPIKYELSQNYPNPFNPSTTITLTLPVNEIVSLSVYNMLGEEIQIIQNGFLEAGIYSYNFNAEGLPSGVYFYKLETPTKILHRKMLLIK